ncbi:hypothetical protein [Nocardioides pakistanensis]
MTWLVEIRRRAAEVDWRAEAVLVGKVVSAVTLAAAPYPFAWLAISGEASVSATDVLLAVGTLAISVPLFSFALRLAGARRAWFGGVYIAGLTGLMGAWTILFRGADQVSPGSWLGAAGCVAIIYALDYGSPTKYPVSEEPSRLDAPVDVSAP